MLRPLNWGQDPFLARPFSIADLDDDELHILFQVTGKGTTALSELKPGEAVKVWGPLGNGFAIQEQVPTLLLAGGIGIAPFVGMVSTHQRLENLELLFGHRQDLSNFPFAKMSEVILAWSHQDRNSSELQAFIRALEVKIEAYAQDGLIFACGPTPFLKKVQEVSARLGARTQVSLERHMACGLGACLGCVCNSVQGELLRTCVDGPVFWAEQIEL
jgi:dihydroorotate dehydrogenase electron transfer subunit